MGFGFRVLAVEFAFFFPPISFPFLHSCTLESSQGLADSHSYQA
jgi:hypothetical protein